MGVDGLWDTIKTAGEPHSLARLAVVDGFEKNTSGRRALRVGIDVSLWLHQVRVIHKNDGELGDNPELRTLFFRLCALAEWPIVPLFVFDGRNRPAVKRGSKKGKSGSLPMAQPMKTLLDHFGMQWFEAKGEAEAELACFNQEGKIDAIMTDDVDALVFGGKTVIRNSSLDLSGNKANPARNKNGTVSKHHVMVYTAEAVRTHPTVGLSRGALILFALLAGGDYDSGIPNVGKHTASGLARCGFGDRLLDAFERYDKQHFTTFLVGWRTELSTELHSNSHGFLKQRYPSLTISPDFPDYQVLSNYAAPVVWEKQKRVSVHDNKEINIAAIAGFCEDKFSEWGHRAAIIKRFRTLLWKGAVMHVLRRAALYADKLELERRLNGRGKPTEAVGTPTLFVRQALGFTDRASREARISAAFVNQSDQQSDAAVPDAQPLLVKIVRLRESVQTDRLLEFRVVVCPSELLALADSGIKRTRKTPSESAERNKNKTKQKATPEPESLLEMWIPATMLQEVHPVLIDEYFADPPAEGAPSDDESAESGSPLATKTQTQSSRFRAKRKETVPRKRTQQKSGPIEPEESDGDDEMAESDSEIEIIAVSSSATGKRPQTRKRRASLEEVAPRKRTRRKSSAIDDIIDLTLD